MLYPVWGIMLLVDATGFAADPSDRALKDPAIHVECHGKIREGVVAAGGETTGMTITFDGMTWELKFPDESSRTAAKKHHKQPVTVVGSLRKMSGKAIPVRWIVDVERMTPRDTAAQPEQAHVKVSGMLRKQTTAGGGPQIMAIEADHITWPLDLSSEKSMQTKAASMVGKPVVLEGRLERGSDAKSPPQPTVHVKKLDAPTGKIGSK